MKKVSLAILGVVVFILWSLAMMAAWSAPVFVVSGKVIDGSGKPQDGWKVTVENTTRAWKDTDVTGQTAESGAYQVVRLDFMENNAADVGDSIKVTFQSPDNAKTEVKEKSLTVADIENAFTSIDLSLGAAPSTVSLSSAEPLSVFAGSGETLTLKGTGFQEGVLLVVNGKELPATFKSATEAAATLPADLPAGTYDLTVKNPDGKTATLAQSLTVSPLPTLLVAEPVNGTKFRAGTAVVTLSVNIGNHFGSWQWKLNAPFPASGIGNGTTAASGKTATIAGLTDGKTYTIYAALVDAQGNLLKPSIAAQTTISVNASPSDVDGDGEVSILDLVTVARDFGKSEVGLDADIDGNGTVDIVDIVMVAQRFGEKFTTAAPPLAYAGELPLVTTARAALSDSEILLDVALPQGSRAIAGYDLEVAYDPSQLRLVGSEEGNALRSNGETFSYVPESQKPGAARIVGARIGAEAGASGSELARWRFQIIGNRAAALSSLRLVRADLSDTQVKRIRGILNPVRQDIRLSNARGTLVAQNYPNPFNPETWIPYQLKEDSSVSVRIFSGKGESVRRLDLGVQPAGGYVTRDRAAYWDGRNDAGETVSSGVYFYEFRAGSYFKVGRMLIMK